MDRRAQAALHRDRAKQLISEWNVDVVQGRYSHDGHWYAKLTHFPAALFDANGYVRFATEQAYLISPHLRIGKQISVQQPGISAIPGYVLIVDSEEPFDSDVQLDSTTATEGQRRLVLHVQRERNRTLRRKKKEQVASLDCEVCGFSFGHAYGAAAQNYCEVHHLSPLSAVESSTETRTEDLAILCANCHRVAHLRNPPYTLDQIKHMLTRKDKESACQADSSIVCGVNASSKRPRAVSSQT